MVSEKEGQGGLKNPLSTFWDAARGPGLGCHSDTLLITVQQFTVPQHAWAQPWACWNDSTAEQALCAPSSHLKSLVLPWASGSAPLPAPPLYLDLWNRHPGRRQPHRDSLLIHVQEEGSDLQVMVPLSCWQACWCGAWSSAGVTVSLILPSGSFLNCKM